MKLFYKPGACSLASHITLRESGKDFTLVSVDLMAEFTIQVQQKKKYSSTRI